MSHNRKPSAAALPVEAATDNRLFVFIKDNLFSKNEGIAFSALPNDVLYEVLKFLTLSKLLNFMLASKHCRNAIDSLDSNLFSFCLNQEVLTKTPAGSSPGYRRHLYLFDNTARINEFYAVVISGYSTFKSSFIPTSNIYKAPELDISERAILKSLEKATKVCLFKSKAQALVELKNHFEEDLLGKFWSVGKYPLLMVRTFSPAILLSLQDEFRETQQVTLPLDKFFELEFVCAEFHESHRVTSFEFHESHRVTPLMLTTRSFSQEIIEKQQEIQKQGDKGCNVM